MSSCVSKSHPNHPAKDHFAWTWVEFRRYLHPVTHTQRSVGRRCRRYDLCDRLQGQLRLSVVVIRVDHHVDLCFQQSKSIIDWLPTIDTIPAYGLTCKRRPRLIIYPQKQIGQADRKLIGQARRREDGGHAGRFSQRRVLRR